MTDDELIEQLHKRSKPQTWRHPEDKRVMAEAASRITELKETLTKLKRLWDAAAFPANVAEAGELYDEIDRTFRSALSQGGEE